MSDEDVYIPLTETSLEEVIDAAGGHPVLEAVFTAIASIVFEDPTVVTCGMLIADGKVGTMPIFIGLFFGIVVGDLLLFFTGRYFGPWIRRKQFLSEEKFENARAMLDKNLILAILACRFLPGTRVPVFLSAGIFGASPIKFALIAGIASFIWTFTLLFLSIRIGELLLPLLGGMKWFVLGALILSLIVYRFWPKTNKSSSPVVS